MTNEQFALKLKELRVYSKYMRNLRAEEGSKCTIDSYFKDSDEDFSDRIYASFDMINAPEGRDFWYSISNK